MRRGDGGVDGSSTRAFSLRLRKDICLLTQSFLPCSRLAHFITMKSEHNQILSKFSGISLLDSYCNLCSPWSTLSARDFLNHFKPSFSQIGKPDSHSCYASQHKTPYPLVFSTPFMSNHTKKNKEQYRHWRRL